VLLVGNDSLVRDWVHSALRDTEFLVAGETASDDEALGLISQHRPDVLLVDCDGAALGTMFVSELRARGIETPALLMKTTPERGFSENARAAGAQGTILKTGSIGKLLAALRAVVQGELSFDPRHPQRPPDQSKLSPRERDVLRRVARGATNREIAGELGIGDETVKTLLARSCAKLGVRRRDEAARAAHGLGLL
jgi:DNA-binding NarL/FixJ family response regulator